MLSSCSLSLTQRAATAGRPIQSRRCIPTVRTARRHVVSAAQQHDIDDPVLVVNRRGALAATALTSATLATGASMLTPADAQAIIAGYSDAGGDYSVALCIHETPSYQKWYDEVFSSAAPKAVEAFSAVRILTMKQIDGSQIAVMAIVPTNKLDVVQGFYDQQKNPLWAEGREAGWLQGTFAQQYFTPALFRGADPGPPPPNLQGKGLTITAHGLGIPFDDWKALFTAPDTDKLHDAFGIVNSVAGKVVKGSDGFGANPNAVAVTHIFSSPSGASAIAKTLGPDTDAFKNLIATGVIKPPYDGPGMEGAFVIMTDNIY